jgi:hypothetical protein
VDASGLEGSDLVGSTTLSSGDNSTSVTHATAWRGSLSSDEADNGQVAVVVSTKPVCGLFLGLSADLTNHDNSLCLRIVNEHGKDINEVGAVERITTDSNDGRLTELMVRGLVDSLVSEGAGAGYNSDLAFLVDVTRHDSDFALARLNDSGAVRSDKTGLVLGLHDGLDLDHVEGGDALSDADNEIHFGLDGLQDGVGSEGRGHVDDGSLGASGGFGLGDGAVDGKSEVSGAGLALVHSTNDLSAVGEGLLGVESTL